MKKILILCSGGDAPGMNAAIRAVVRLAHHEGIEIFSTEPGFDGLIDKNVKAMPPSSVANCIQRGGTIIKSSRSLRFHDENVRAQCRQYLIEQQFDGMVVLGGNGSFQGARLLAEDSPIQVVGIPCTIDNDIVGTDYCIGFDTARNTALEAIDRIRDTALSHDRNFIIEVMGRNSGALAVDVGIAGGAEITLIPEIPYTISELVTKIQNKRRYKLASIIVAAEADKPGHTLELAKQIEKACGIVYRVCVLGHTQRGGSPTATDRKQASLMGALAFRCLQEGKTNRMIARINGTLTDSAFPNPNQSTARVQDTQLLDLNEILCDMSESA